MVFLKVVIIPKWLIKVPGHISILFGSFLELPKISPTMAPYTPFFITKTFQKVQEQILKHFERLIFCRFWRQWAPTNPEESFNEISKIMDMRPISMKKHEWIFANMVPISTTKHKMIFSELWF